MTSLEFDTRFINEITAKAMSCTQREAEWLANVGLRKELTGIYDEKTIARIESIYWLVSVGKSAAARAGV